MKACSVLDCDRLCEGNTDMCATHNRQSRKQKSDIKAIEAIRKRQPPSKAIRKVSGKLALKLKEYTKNRANYLKTHPYCEMKLMGCEKEAIEIHHSAGRGANLNNVATFKATCRNCHNQLHNVLSAKEARERGLKTG